MTSRVLQSQVMKPLSVFWTGHMHNYYLKADLEKKTWKMYFSCNIHIYLADALICEQNPRNITSNLKYKVHVTHLQL